jgi:hypothetical protein
MLDKIDRRSFASADLPWVVQTIQATLYQQGISLQQTSPNTWSGRGQQPSYGLVVKAGLTVTQMPDQALVDLLVTADIEGSGIVIVIVAWIFFFPLAIILLVLGYQDWERRSNELRNLVWTPLSKMIAPRAPPPMGAAPGRWQVRLGRSALTTSVFRDGS